MATRHPHLAWATAAQTLLAAVACFVPLFNLLGYEFALATGLLAAITGPLIGFGRGRDPGACRMPHALVSTCGAAVLHLLPGLLLISLNALRVRNCNFAQGLGFAAALSLSTAVYGAAIGFAVARLLRRSGRAARAGVLVAALALPLLMTLRTLYREPPIFAFDHLWGFFAGSLYDETIRLDARLVAFRIGTLLRVLLVAGVLASWERVGERLGRLRRQRVAFMAALLGAIAVSVGYDGWVGKTYGFRVTQRQIEAALPTTVTLPGLIIHLTPGLSKQQQQAIADDHAFRLEQLEARLNIHVDAPIHSYVYRDAEEKARLMGGRGTMVAKPWLRQIHIHGTQTPHPVLAHELVHAMLAPFGSAPLRVPARFGVLVNLGLVEGIAVAASPDAGDLDLHHATRALHDLGKAPDVQTILAPSRFWAQAAPQAYATAGSFIRYLLDTHGTEPLLRAYANGDLATAYDRPMADLIEAWQQFLGHLEIGPRELALADERFRRPSIFARTCAHEVARLRQAARHAAPAEAVSLQREICEHLGNTASARLDLALALQRQGDTDAFVALATPLLADDDLNTADKARLLTARGDLLWERHDYDGAGAAAADALLLNPDAGSQRLQWVRGWAVRQAPTLRAALFDFLTAKLEPAVGALVLSEYACRSPSEKTLAYLVGRQIVAAGAYEAAATQFERAAGHPFPLIESERLRLLGESAWRLMQWDKARAAFLAWLASAPTSGTRADAQDWLARIDWHQRQEHQRQEHQRQEHQRQEQQRQGHQRQGHQRDPSRGPGEATPPKRR